MHLKCHSEHPFKVSHLIPYRATGAVVDLKFEVKTVFADKVVILSDEPASQLEGVPVARPVPLSGKGVNTLGMRMQSL